MSLIQKIDKAERCFQIDAGETFLEEAEITIISLFEGELQPVIRHLQWLYQTKLDQASDEDLVKNNQDQSIPFINNIFIELFTGQNLLENLLNIEYFPFETPDEGLSISSDPSVVTSTSTPEAKEVKVFVKRKKIPRSGKQNISVNNTDCIDLEDEQFQLGPIQNVEL